MSDSQLNQVEEDIKNYSDTYTPVATKKKSNKQYVINKKEIPSDKNAYVYQNPQNKNRWCLYFYDRFADTRHRIVLIDPATGMHPSPTPKGQDEAWVLGIAKFVELKGKSDRGESINSITFKELCDKFLRKEASRVSEIPHRGITKVRYRLIKSQVKWIRDFVNNDKIMIHKMRRNTFTSYEIWRINKAREYGKDTPQPATINSELSTLGRLFRDVAVVQGFLTEATMPIIPKMKKRDKDNKPRRDDLTEKEWLEIEKVSRLYFIKGKSRILDEKTYKIEKNKGGSYKTRTTVSKVSARGRNNITHRIMFYNAMRIAMDTGIRIGSLKKLKWKHIAITENSALPKSEQKMYVSVNVPAENTKTGSSYRITAPIAAYLNNIRRVVRRDLMKPNNFIFCNQGRKEEKVWSARIWEDYLMEVLVEARLANWNPDMKRGHRNKRIIIHSGKNITFYSFRHTYITMRLKSGTPLAVVASQCNTSLKYIQDHYYHYRSDENIEQLMKGREKFIKPARGDLSWIDQIETEDFG